MSDRENPGAAVEGQSASLPSDAGRGIHTTVLAASANAAARWSVEQLPIVDRASYQITGQIARGGVGRIWRARDVRLGRLVAIKELIQSSEASAERFVREALLTARMRHPAVIPIYEAGRWPTGEPFYSMKLVESRSLASIIAESPTFERRLGVLPHVLAATEAVAYAHSQGIIHRDLKPHNVLVGSFGETVVIDWGLAKDLADEDDDAGTPTERERASQFDAGLTVAGSVLGTPAYMAPEQALGKAADERTDVYALGAILYHLLGGASPYEGADAAEIVKQVIARPPRPLAARQRGIPLDLLTIVGKAMTRDPRGRYPTAKELAEDLRRFVTGQIVGAHHYSPRERVWRLLRRYKAELGVIVAAFCVVAIVGVASFRSIIIERDRAAQKQAEAVQRADELTLLQARTALDRDPNKAIGWLRSLSPSFSGFRAVRFIAADAKARGLATELRGHSAGLNAAAFSPDGRLLATTSDDRSVRLWDMVSGDSIALLGHTDEVHAAHFSPDSALLATRSKDETVRLWDVRTGVSQIIQQHEGGVRTLAFSPDGAWVASGGADQHIRLWSVREGGSRVLSGHKAKVLGLSFSPDSAKLASASVDGTARIWDIASGDSKVLTGHEGDVMAIAFSPSGDAVATGSKDKTVRLWNVESGQGRVVARHGQGVYELAFSSDGHSLASLDRASVLYLDLTTGSTREMESARSRVWGLRFSPDNLWLAAGSHDGTLRLWSVESGEQRKLMGFEDAVRNVVFSPDGQLVAALSWDHTVRLFPVAPSSGRVLGRHDADVIAAALSPDGALLLTVSVDGVAYLWGLRGGEPEVLRGQSSAILQAAFSPSGNLVATGEQDGTTRVWDLHGSMLQRFPRHRGGVTSVAFSPDGGSIASAGEEGAIQIVAIGSGESRWLRGHTGAVSNVAFSPNGARIASSGFDKTVRLWDIASGVDKVLKGHSDKVSVIVFSPDGSQLASGGSDHQVRLWDMAGNLVRVIDAGGTEVTEILFSQDGAQLFVLNGTNAVGLWDVETGAQVRLLRGHEEVVLRASLSPDGHTLVTASADTTVRFWDLWSDESRACQGHREPVQHVWFLPDGKAAVSIGRDRTIRLWPDDLPESPGALRAFLQSVAMRIEGW